jgi:hypothetical protein
LGGMLLIPRLRPSRLDGTGPKAIMYKPLQNITGTDGIHPSSPLPEREE